jgi:subfamily B ATP-binding cassette protein MsbA
LTPAEIYRRLLAYAWRYWPVFIAAVIFMAIASGTDAAFAWIMKPMLDGSFVEKDPDIIRWLPFALLGIFLLRGITSFLASYGMERVGRLVIRDMRQQLFNHLLRLPSRYYDRHPSGQLTSKLIFDVERVAQAATTSVTIIVRDTFSILGLIGLMFYTSWQLSLVFLLVGPLITLIVVGVSKRFRRISARIQASMGNVTQLSQQVIDGQRVVKIFGGEEQEQKTFAAANDYNRRQNMKMAATSAVSVPVSQFLAACGLAVILFLATSDDMLAKLTVGTFMSFVAASMLLLSPMKRLTMVQATVQQGIAAAQSVFQLLDEAAERDTGTRVAGRSLGAIEYRDVTFIYDSAKGAVLEHVSFSARPGETIAIVGRSGSGKSTLVNLLPRFYEADSGTILLDGTPVQDYTLASLRRQIALVSQDVTLFNDTIANNIAYGMAGAVSRAEIERAAQAAHVMDFVRALPDGLDTLIGEKGVLLSGGQRQRIAIARALLKDAPVLILDEATSALDSESERYIQEALNDLMQQRTTLVIAHRLSTVEKADRILVLRKGRLVEEGTHQQLLAANGDYAALYQMQFTEAAPADIV